jgi:hypothetical protein
MDCRRRVSRWGRCGSVGLRRRWHCRRRVSERIHGWCRSRWPFGCILDIAFSPSFNPASRAFFEAKCRRLEKNLMSKYRSSATHTI